MYVFTKVDQSSDGIGICFLIAIGLFDCEKDIGTPVLCESCIRKRYDSRSAFGWVGRDAKCMYLSISFLILHGNEFRPKCISVMGDYRHHHPAQRLDSFNFQSGR
jgi:hypothetical protein